jgi:ribosomal protein L7/L12
MSPELKQEILNLLSQGQLLEAKSLAFQHFGSLSEADTFIQQYGQGDGAIMDLINAGKLIEAVKFVRDRHGWGLKESKDYVDRLRGL